MENFWNEYEGDILAAPAGNNVREVVLTLKKVEQTPFAKVKINGMIQVIFTFTSSENNNDECTITKNYAKKVSANEKDCIKYNFVKNFVDKMRLVAEIPFKAKNKELIGKEFTILIYNNQNNQPEYDIKTTTDDADNNTEDTAF